MPASPPSVYVPPSGDAPAAPGAVYVPGAAGPARTVAGTISPDATGVLVPVAVPDVVVYPAREQWTTDGNPTRPLTGAWSNLYRAYLVVPEETTLEELAPLAEYSATGIHTTASNIIVSVYPMNGAFSTYWAYTNLGDPRWIKTGPGVDDQGGLVLAAGTLILPRTRVTDTTLIGGLGDDWENDPETEWCWLLAHYADNVFLGYWTGIGTTPQTAVWHAYSAATGDPLVTAGGVVAPGGIFSVPSGDAPDVPGGIFAAPSGDAPGAPGGIFAAPSGDAPGAPGGIFAGGAPVAPLPLTLGGESLTLGGESLTLHDPASPFAPLGAPPSIYQPA